METQRDSCQTSEPEHSHPGLHGLGHSSLGNPSGFLHVFLQLLTHVLKVLPKGQTCRAFLSLGFWLKCLKGRDVVFLESKEGGIVKEPQTPRVLSSLTLMPI